MGNTRHAHRQPLASASPHNGRGRDSQRARSPPAAIALQHFSVAPPILASSSRRDRLELERARKSICLGTNRHSCHRRDPTFASNRSGASVRKKLRIKSLYGHLSRVDQKLQVSFSGVDDRAMSQTGSCVVGETQHDGSLRGSQHRRSAPRDLAPPAVIGGFVHPSIALCRDFACSFCHGISERNLNRLCRKIARSRCSTASGRLATNCGMVLPKIARRGILGRIALRRGPFPRLMRYRCAVE